MANAASVRALASIRDSSGLNLICGHGRCGCNPEIIVFVETECLCPRAGEGTPNTGWKPMLQWGGNARRVRGERGGNARRVRGERCAETPNAETLRGLDDMSRRQTALAVNCRRKHKIFK